MPNTAESYRLLREFAAIVRPEPTALLYVSGSDAIEWLQGQATNDLRSLADLGRASFCLCKPSGQIEAVCTVWRIGTALHLSMPKACAPAVLNRLETMVILEDVMYADFDDTELTSVQGPAAEEVLSRRFDPIPNAEIGRREWNDVDAMLARNDRCGFGGWDLWAERGLLDALNLPEADAAAYEAVRIEAGIPLWGKDIGPKTLPPEMGAAFEAKHVSYTKGCYVGQEVLMRMHSRGRANWDWMGLAAESPLEVGAKVSTIDRPDAGTVTSVAVSPRLGPIGAARVRREIALDGQFVTVRQSTGDVRARLRAFPMD